MEILDLLELELEKEYNLIEAHKKNVELIKSKIQKLSQSNSVEEKIEKTDQAEGIKIKESSQKVKNKEGFLEVIDQNVAHLTRGLKYFKLRDRSKELKDYTGEDMLYKVAKNKYSIGSLVFSLKELAQIFCINQNEFLNHYSNSTVGIVDKVLFIRPEDYDLRFKEINWQLRSEIEIENFKNSNIKIKKKISSNLDLEKEKKYNKNNDPLYSLAEAYSIDYYELKKKVNKGFDINMAVSSLTEKVYVGDKEMSLYDVAKKYGLKYKDVLYHYNKGSLAKFLNVNESLIKPLYYNIGARGEVSLAGGVS